jgi:rubrerythrin
VERESVEKGGEKMFDEFFTSGSIDVVKGVEIGIELEKKSIAFYREKSKNLENKAAADLLKFIETEEASHLKHLEMLKQNLIKKKGWVSADKLGKPEGPRLYEKGVEPKIEEGSKDFSVLLAAARAEAEARNFYEEFSQKIPDKEGSKFFKKLAEFEQTHYDLFNGILEASEVRVENAEL